MDFVTPVPSWLHHTTPHFLHDAGQLRACIEQLSISVLQQLIRVSPELADKTRQLYRQRPLPHKAALWAYAGDVYKGFQVATLDQESAAWAQQHLLIASGLYGLVRPFDEIGPYRLEMKAKLQVGNDIDLYAFWGDRLSSYVTGRQPKELLVLSSEEYAKGILKYLPNDIHVCTPAFLDTKPNGQLAQVPIYNKMMRGVMARWVVEHRLEQMDGVQHFSAHGYGYDATRSTADRPVFTRAVMRPLVF